MSEARGIKLGWGRIWSALVLAASAGFVGWTAIRMRDLIAEIDALNSGKPGWPFPVNLFAGSAVALGVGLALLLRRKPGFAAAVAVGVALFAQICWIGMTH